jgi:4-amino-4-deoxy-L-arabinose transferase-like glycosyltransferase
VTDASAGALGTRAPRCSFVDVQTLDDRRVRWAVVALLLLAFALRVAGLEFQSLWRDEVDAIRFASRPILVLLEMFNAPAENGPLYYLLLRPWLRVVGQSEFSLRFFSVFFGVLAVPLIFRLAQRLFLRQYDVALVAVLLATTSPYLAWYSQEGKMYALVVFLVLLSMERYLTALEKGGWHRWAMYILATATAIYVHVIAALIIPVQIVTFFLQSHAVRRARWRPWLATLAILILPYLPLLAWQLPLILTPAETGFRFVPLHGMLLSLWDSYSFGVVQDAVPWSAVAFTAALVAAVLLFFQDRASRTVFGVLVCWLLLPVLSLFLITLVRPLFTARYLVYVVPAYLLLLAAGIVAVGRRTRLLAGLLLIAILAVNGWGLRLQSQTLIKADYRSATEYLLSRAGPQDLILFQIPYGRHSFEYYAHSLAFRESNFARPNQAPSLQSPALHRAYVPLLVGGRLVPYRWAEGLYTNAGMLESEVDWRMEDMVGDSAVVWLVSSEAPMWDERALVEGWLAEHGNLTDVGHFVRVSVYRYQLHPGP